MSDSTLLKVPIKWVIVMQPTRVNCKVLNLIDIILIKIVIEGPGSHLLGTQGFGGGKKVDGSGSWGAMTLAFSLLGGPPAAAV